MVDLKALLQEEKNMGKNAHSSYKTATFQEVDKKLEAMRSDEKRIELRQNAINLMRENPDSIILTYVAGKIKLMLRPHESNIMLNNLALDFYNVRNWDAAEFIALNVLKAAESPKALRVMGDVSSEKNDEVAKWDYYERFVKADNQDVEIIVKVADHYDSIGDKKNAMSFYQRALLRLAKTDDEAKIRDIFKNLLENGKTDFPFYVSYVDGISERNTDLAMALYKELINYLIKERAELKKVENKPSEIRMNLDNIILVARKILLINPLDNDVRVQIVDALKIKFSASSRYAECSKKYNILQSSDPIKAIDDFTKDIAYCEKTYVLQNSLRKVGLITSVQNGMIKVRYSATEEQEIPLEAAYTALQPLTNQHIKAIKKGVPAQKIVSKINSEGGIKWLVKTLLYSASDNKLQLKDMKAEVVPLIMDEVMWKQVAEKIKEEVKVNPYIRIIPGASDTYELTAYPSTPEEKVLYGFRASNTVYEKAEVMIEALKDNNIDKTSDAFLEMVDYFLMVSNDKMKATDLRLSATIMVDYALEKKVPAESDVDFEDIFNTLTELEIKDAFRAINNTVIKKEFIDKVYKCDKNAYDTLETLFPYYVSSYIPSKMQRLNKKRFNEFVAKIVNNFRENMQVFVYFATDAKLSEEQMKASNLSYDKMFKTELMAIATCHKTADSQENRKNTKALLKDLIESKAIENYIKNAPRESIDEIKGLIIYNEGLETEDKKAFKTMILSRFPDYDFGEGKKPVVVNVVKALSGFLATEASYDRKIEELKEIKEVQIPANLKEIQAARELGDLRENSEYQYAKEHKRELDRRVAELSSDLNTVKVVKKEDVVPGLVGFGMKVHIKDNLENREFYYTFFGRWESDPDNGIIDLNAPVGRNLINHKAGDRVEFDINGRACDYTILDIEEVDF